MLITSAVCLVLMLIATALPLACTQDSPSLTAEPDPERQQEELARLQQVVARGEGDVGSGRQIFNAHCGTCHQLYDAGEGKAGPNLTPYKRDEEAIPFLVQVIAAPKAEVHPYHAMFEIRTRDGRTLSGVMSERDDEGVTLINVAGDEIHIPRDQITSERPLETSLMPDHLITEMTDQQVSDLFAFLLSEQPQDD